MSVSAETSREAIPATERQSARFGVSFSVKIRSSRSRYERILSPTGALVGSTRRPDASSETPSSFAEQSIPLDSIPRTLATLIWNSPDVCAGQGAWHYQAWGDIGSATDDLQWRKAGIDAADVETISIRMLVNSKHASDNNLIEEGRDSLFLLNLKPAMVRR